MKVWIIKVGELLPTDGRNARLMRAGLLAEELARSGHEAVFWTSTFNHQWKVQRSTQDTCTQVREGYELRMLRAPEYRRNISFRRAKHDMTFALRFHRAAKADASVPDVLFCAMPTPEIAAAAIAYGKRRGIPVIIDLRDMWPDIFFERLPAFTRHARWFLPQTWMVRHACRSATALTGISEDFVRWGAEQGGRTVGPLDRSFPLAQPSATVDSDMKESEVARSVERNHAGKLIVTFCGSFTQRNRDEYLCAIEAARLLEARGAQIAFVFCGSGVSFEACARAATGLSNVTFTGWVGAHDIARVLAISHLGLLPYQNTPDFRMSVPNKAVEYLSAGLPVVTGVHGDIEKVMRSYRCGANYTAGDAESLAELLQSLEANRALVAEMSAHARRAYAERFDARVVYREMVSYLEEIARPAQQLAYS